MSADTSSVALARSNASAVIGALGVVVGVVLSSVLALLTAWLQGRRERAARADQWKRDDVVLHRAGRMASYEELSRTTYNAMLVCARTMHTIGGPPNAAVAVELTEAITLAVARVRLSGSARAAVAADTLAAACMELIVAAFESMDGGPAPRAARNDAASARAGAALTAFTNAARVDLGHSPLPTVHSPPLPT